MKLLENKVALITGASKGIGRSIAQRFIEEGAKVAFTFLSSVERGKSLEAELSLLGGEAKGFQSDASSSEQAEKLINDVIAHFGQIDIIVNNAGITKDTLMLRMSEEDFDSVINTNLKSVFNTTKHAQRSMLKQRSGSIINISSIVGSRGIRCNAVAPGFIETEMTSVLDEKTVQSWRDAIPLKRGGKPEDVANACVYLGSDLSSYVSGQVLQVDGGLLT